MAGPGPGWILLSRLTARAALNNGKTTGRRRAAAHSTSPSPLRPAVQDPRRRRLSAPWRKVSLNLPYRPSPYPSSSCPNRCFLQHQSQTSMPSTRKHLWTLVHQDLVFTSTGYDFGNIYASVCMVWNAFLSHGGRLNLVAVCRCRAASVKCHLLHSNPHYSF
jgi:hypothetical protein